MCPLPTNWSEIVGEAMQARPLLDLPRRFNLPCAPQSVIEFTSIAKDPNAGPKELAAPIEADPALTSDLLRQVNSTAVGLQRTVASISQAINLLGLRRTKTLVLTSALQSATRSTSSRLINLILFQKENRIRATFARRMAEAIGADSETAYLAGLLQDFLLPLLTEAFSADYAVALPDEHDLSEKEECRFGWTHAQIAAGVMYDWGFPDELVACVLLHHTTDRILSDVLLRESTAASAVAAASLPDSLAQSPAGFETLLKLQSELANFGFLEIAADVDEELNCADLHQEHGLCDRLARLAEASLENRRLERVHQLGQLGSYILERQIGQGSMGLIYLARHCLLKRPAAIKVLRSANVGPDLLALFETEVQLTCQLTSPNTVAVYDYGVTPEGLFYYVMEYLEGVTLAALVRERGPLPAGRVIHFLRQACASLAEAHSYGLIHRDLKPDNMMVCNRGGIPDTIKVLDFGLATVVSKCPVRDRDEAPIGMSGTPTYMSPESITAPQTVDGRSDLYCLGAVGYFLLTGQTVFPAPSIEAVLHCHRFDRPERPSVRLGAPIDDDLEDVILQCLSKSREDRPGSPAELQRMLDRCQSTGSWTPQDALQQIAFRKNVQPSKTADDTTDENLSATLIAHPM